MTSDLRSQLQATLGETYILERELGGGGMSRVFVADETALGRKVVVKVLPPELVAGVSVERFKREIQVAARLQHPHIVPVLSAGESSGLPFYTMPFVEGSSLRQRLAAGPMPSAEVIGILREVARALAYAHEHGVVHRDIKPDNVLITAGSAVVTDFGIAKALSASRMVESTGATLTQLGTSIGTPAYMAPEQATGDPATNHRADIYAFGAMAYELLAGHTVFPGLPPHRLLAAHMGETPRDIRELAPDTPESLAQLVMRCLEKDPDQRPQQASDIAHALGAVTSNETQRSLPDVLLGGRGMLQKALLYYAAAYVLVAVLARAAIIGIGLPDWVFPGALIVMGLGLPVILFTAYVQRATHRALVATPTLTPGGSVASHGTMANIALKASPHVSWRRTAMGGSVAVAVFVVLVAGWMVMRALGVGPAASLMSSGKLGEREKVILADFKGPAGDSLMGPTVTDAFRTDIGQSRNLSIMSANSVREALRLMQRPLDVRVDFGLAREIATREGIKAVIDGEIVALGGSYVLSARLVAAQDGEELASFRETASEAKDIIPAISRISKQLRSRVGESLKAIQNARTLDKVTTASLPALQKYVSGVRALENEADFAKGKTLLEQAIALDTGFAMAYRKLAIELNNRGLERDRVDTLYEKALAHRDRLTDAEQSIMLGSYYGLSGPKPDVEKSIAAYEALLDANPKNVTALNNLAVQYAFARQYAKADSLARRAIDAEPTAAVFFTNAFYDELALGQLQQAESTVAQMARYMPRHPDLVTFRSDLAYKRGEYDRADALLDSVARAHANDPVIVGGAVSQRARLAELRGHLSQSLSHERTMRKMRVALGNRQASVNALLDSAYVDTWYRGDKPRAFQTLQRAVAMPVFDSLSPRTRPYLFLARLYAQAEHPREANAMMQAFERTPGATSLPQSRARHAVLGEIAIAEKRYDDAVREFIASDMGECSSCALPDIARAYDLAGKSDSAIAYFQRFVDHVERNAELDAPYLAGAHKRLAELYEAKGDQQRAKSQLAAFIELWKDADPELQPKVKDARTRLAVLQRAEKR